MLQRSRSLQNENGKVPCGSVATGDAASPGGCDPEGGTVPGHGAPLRESVGGFDLTSVMARTPQ